jgi:hypothetical protein
MPDVLSRSMLWFDPVTSRRSFVRKRMVSSGMAEIHLAGAAVPVRAIFQIALHFVQHRVNPGGDAGVILLDDPMRPIPLPGQSQVNRVP